MTLGKIGEVSYGAGGSPVTFIAVHTVVERPANSIHLQSMRPMQEPQRSGALRIGLAQTKPTKGDVAANIGGINALLTQHCGDVDLLVFPEVALSGYFLEGGVREAARTVEEVAEALVVPPGEAPDIAIGFYERYRRSLFNSVAYFTPTDSEYVPIHVHRKVFLPTYGVFDEARFVEHGREVHAFDTRFGRMGMLICEEMWHSLPATILALDGAEVILTVSASPARDFNPSPRGRPRNLEVWATVAPAAAVEHGVFVTVSQLVGSEGGKIFPGGSIAAAPDGTIIAQGPLLEEAVTLVELDGTAIDRARANSPLLSDLEHALPHLQRALQNTQMQSAPSEESPGDEAESGTYVSHAHTLTGKGEAQLPGSGRLDPEDLSILELDLDLVQRVLVEFIREELVRRRGFEKVVIGVSGGVDSAVSLYLATLALGPENVFGFRLPYATSSQESLDHAKVVLEATGAHSRTIDITGSVDAYVEDHEPDLTPLRRGNLAARLRAITLFDQSAKIGGLPLGTGNKSERLLGYYTWHADDSPPINPLGDLFKTQVWELARHLGVPDMIIDKPASADLVKGVHDEDELGISYHRADPILHWILKGYSPEELQASGFPGEEVELVWKRLNSTHWKRELPTVAMLSSSAIGAFYLRPVDY